MVRKKHLRLVNRRIVNRKERNVSEAQDDTMNGNRHKFDPKGLTGLEETLAELDYAMAHPDEYKYYTDIDELMRDLLSD
ncbi:MAG: hypothetical protein K6G50_11515 [bacterium]|nr:hypothetical protein [bacterium]